MNVGSRRAERESRFHERGDERLKQASRAHGGVILVLASLVALRGLSFVTFSILLAAGPSLDIVLFRTVMIVDGALGMVLDLAVVFVALLLFSTVRRIEHESDRMQVFMDTVYRRLP